MNQPGELPVAGSRIRALRRYAMAHPWSGRTMPNRQRHMLATTAITEPGRPTSVLCTFDIGHHGSGWWANADYDRALHLSIAHPVEGQTELRQTPAGTLRQVQKVETPTDTEARAWGWAFFQSHAPKAWFEPAAPVGDPYRMPNVVHLRLFYDKFTNEPILPTGEVYHLRPWADGSSPAKVTEGRAGADVR